MDLSTASEASLISLLTLIERAGILGRVHASTIRVLAVCATTRLSGRRGVRERECRRRDECQTGAEQGKFLFHMVLQSFLLSLKTQAALLRIQRGAVCRAYVEQFVELILRQRTIPDVLQ